MEVILNIPLHYLVAALLLWLLGFYWLVKHPEWIAALVLAFFFFMPALVDLAFGGKKIPTGQLTLLIFGPPLLASMLIRKTIVKLVDVALLLAYAACIAMAILVNGLSFWEVKSALVPVFFALLIYLSIHSRPALYRLLWVYVLLILVNTIVQGLQRAGFMWAYLPSELEVAQAGGFVRGVGLSGHFAMAGLYAVVVFPIAATLFVFAGNLRQRILAVVLGLIGLAGVVFAVLRAALIGAVLGGIDVLWRRRSVRTLSAVGAMLVLSLVLTVVIPPLHEAALAMLTHATTIDDSARNRPRLAEMGLAAWEESPILGGGPNAVDRHVGFPADPHNTFVNVLAETGVVGLGVFLTVLGRAYFSAVRAIHRGYRQEGTALAGALVATLPVAFFHSLNYIVLFWFVPALCLALGRLPKQRHAGMVPMTGKKHAIGKKRHEKTTLFRGAGGLSSIQS
ncbi:hypothetical protein MIN45_P0143 [Methylomarinovum tepidoasis]|uniref:O-antigen ligase-related domain-containing protein n=1 Tax=Methylomarinovum tepidoasis TaxID=2840183 RepID=A0AAU9C7H9_9GAMM|nr:O-antigen ligase family protein [Methylomarinovum sp. IN45]BCX87776.1 hypothetical protein MIN45_P0143 [Methylomarinovum sp. IN45]